MRERVASVHRDASGEGSAGELRHQPVRGAEQGRLARPRRTHGQSERAFVDREVDVLDRRTRPLGIGVGDPVEAERVAHRSGRPTRPGAASEPTAARSRGWASGHTIGEVCGCRIAQPPTDAARKVAAAAMGGTAMRRAATVLGAIDNASAAASAGSWKCRGAIRTRPKGSVTALNVPKITRIVPSRSPSRNENVVFAALTVPKKTSAVRRATATIAPVRNKRKERACSASTRWPAYTNHDTAQSSKR